MVEEARCPGSCPTCQDVDCPAQDVEDSVDGSAYQAAKAHREAVAQRKQAQVARTLSQQEE